MAELKRMSHSKFEDYTRCGEMFRLKRIEKVPTPPMLAGPAGTAFHSWTDEYDLRGYADWETELAMAITSEEEKSGYARKDFTIFGKATKQDQAWYLQTGLDWCEKYVNWREQTGWTVAEELPADSTGNTSGIEYELLFRCGQVEVIAYVDRIWETPDGLVITDTKTAREIKPTEQLVGQTVGCRVNGIPVDRACYYNVRSGETEKQHEFRHWNIDRLRMLYEQTAYAIAEGFFIPRPSGDCFTCMVKRSCLFAI